MSTYTEEKNIKCSIFFEDITSDPYPDESVLCKICRQHPALHIRKPITLSLGNAAASSDNRRHTRDGSRTVLPKWGTGEYKLAKVFLDRMEFVLRGDSVDREFWTSLLLKTMEVNADARFVLDEIVNPKLSWEEARRVFSDHFEVSTYSQCWRSNSNQLNNRKEKLYNVMEIGLWIWLISCHCLLLKPG
jgi:hypothetical protein